MSHVASQAVSPASSHALSPAPYLAASHGAADAPQSSRSLATRRPRIMICEDEAIVADDLQNRLSDMAFDVLGPYATQREAQRALRRLSPDSMPDMAIIDVELADGACTRLAAQLQEAGVYFAVLSGLSPGNPPPEFASAPWLLKPVSDEALRAAIASGPCAPALD